MASHYVNFDVLGTLHHHQHCITNWILCLWNGMEWSETERNTIRIHCTAWEICVGGIDYINMNQKYGPSFRYSCTPTPPPPSVPAHTHTRTQHSLQHSAHCANSRTGRWHFMYVTRGTVYGCFHAASHCSSTPHRFGISPSCECAWHRTVCVYGNCGWCFICCMRERFALFFFSFSHFLHSLPFVVYRPKFCCFLLCVSFGWFICQLLAIQCIILFSIEL